MYNDYMFKRVFYCSVFSLFSLSALFASDDSRNIVFEGLKYPIEANAVTAEKTGLVIYETPYSSPTAFDFNVVMIQGETENLNITLELRYKENRGETKAAVAPETLRIYKNGRFWAKFRLPAFDKHLFKLSFINLIENKDFHITIYEIQGLREAAGKTEVPVSTVPYEPPAELFLPEQSLFKLYKRADWEAQPPKEPYVQHAPKAMTLHHTAGKYTDKLEDSIAEVQFIQDYHQNGRGWIDIGYHFLLDGAGNIFEGRPVNAVGAHVLGKNIDNIGISFLGNYHPPKNDQPAKASIEAAAALGKSLSDNYSIQKSSFYAHRDIGKTDCPGNILYSRMQVLKNLIFEPAPVEMPVKDQAINDFSDPKGSPALEQALKYSKQ